MRASAAALPVSVVASDAEMVARMQRGPPISADDYLMRVRWEGEQLPRVMTAPPGSAAAVAARAAAASPTSILSEEARARLPGTAWRREFVASFAEHRQYVARWAARCAADPSVMPVQRATPDPSDEAAWRAYCFGSATAKGHAPLISVLVGMEERTAAAVLDLHVRWLADCDHASNARAVWIFGLCARLAKPLSEATRGTLRLLVREAARMRAAASDADALHIAPSNILTALCECFGVVE